MNFIQRLAAWWKRPPKDFEGPLWANYFGFEVLRVLLRNAWKRFRIPIPVANDIAPHAATLARDGIVLMPEFLPPEVFSEIRAEYEKELERLPLKPLASPYIKKSHSKLRVSVGHLVPEPHTRLYALLDKHFIKNDFLLRLGSTVVRERIPSFRPPQIFVNKKEGDEYPDLNSDIFYHADVTYPGVKAFLYLSDTGKDNGAFTYAKQSQQLTLKRLRWNYRKSIEHAKNRADDQEGAPDGRAWHCMTREEEKREGIVGTSMTGPANSVVVFNVMGFHRRGEFTSDRPREFVLAYYRT